MLKFKSFPNSASPKCLFLEFTIREKRKYGYDLILLQKIGQDNRIKQDKTGFLALQLYLVF